MTAIFSEHLVESTLFCLFLTVITYCFCKRPATRHAVLLVSVAKFAVPSILLAPAGAELANLWPARSWIGSFVTNIIGVFSMLLDEVLSRIEHLSPPILGLFFTGWILGAAVVLGVWVSKIARHAALLERPTDGEQLLLDEVMEMASVRLPVTLRSSTDGIGPALSGIWRPVLIIPRNLYRKLSAPEFKAVLLHEVAHARRFDNLAASFVHAIVGLFWFHPLLWLVERQMRLERERACDEMAVASGALPKAFASAILKVCEWQVSAPAIGLSHITANDLNRRLELILDSKLSKRVSYLPHVVSAGLIALMAVVSVAGGYCKQCVSTGRNESKHFIRRGVQ